MNIKSTCLHEKTSFVLSLFTSRNNWKENWFFFVLFLVFSSWYFLFFKIKIQEKNKKKSRKKQEKFKNKSSFVFHLNSFVCFLGFCCFFSWIWFGFLLVLSDSFLIYFKPNGERPLGATRRVHKRVLLLFVPEFAALVNFMILSVTMPVDFPGIGTLKLFLWLVFGSALHPWLHHMCISK